MNDTSGRPVQDLQSLLPHLAWVFSVVLPTTSTQFTALAFLEAIPSAFPPEVAFFAPQLWVSWQEKFILHDFPGPHASRLPGLLCVFCLQKNLHSNRS
jgi:hypothetical protein